MYEILASLSLLPVYIYLRKFAHFSNAMLCMLSIHIFIQSVHSVRLCETDLNKKIGYGDEQ